MSRVAKAFTDHPASVGESYAEHLRCALGFSASMCRAALCCTIHAFLPFLFQRTGSRAIEDLHRRMVLQRSKLESAPRRDAMSRRVSDPSPDISPG
jgi:hypothetical protein